jgi:tetratricopeptide (TPR) repeat protein
MQKDNNSKLISVESYIKLADYAKALNILLSILENIPASEKQKQIDLQLKIAQIYERIGTNQSLKSALKILERVKKISDSINYNQGLGGYYFQIGIINSIHQRNWLLGKECFEKSIKLKQIQQPKDYVGIAKCNLQLGTIYAHLAAKKDNDSDLYKEAMNYCRKSLKYRNQSGDIKGKAMCFFGIGNIYRRSGKFNLARIWYIKFKKIALSLADKGMLGDATLALAEIYCNIGDKFETKYSKAFNFYNKAFKEIKICYECRKNMARDSKQFMNFKSQEKIIISNLKRLKKLI